MQYRRDGGVTAFYFDPQIAAAPAYVLLRPIVDLPVGPIAGSALGNRDETPSYVDPCFARVLIGGGRRTDWRYGEIIVEHL